MWTNVGDTFPMTDLLTTVADGKWILVSLIYEREKKIIRWVAYEQYQKFIPVVNLLKTLLDYKRPRLPTYPLFDTS